MRNLRHPKTIALIFILFNPTYAHSETSIYGVSKVFVVKETLKTSVEFDQDELKNYQEKDRLDLQVMDDDKLLREDAIVKQDGIWIWNKILPFSENLKFVILKNNQPISLKYQSNTKSNLVFSDNDSVPMIRGGENSSARSAANGDKKRLPIELPKELKNCKDKALVVVFSKETNALLWQYFGELRDDSITDEIDLSQNPQQRIVIDDGSCRK